jgi:acetyl esterase/lipase
MKNYLILIWMLCCCACKKNNFSSAAVTYKNLSYGPDPNQKMDVYIPALTDIRATPVAILIHGGGWFAGEKEDFDGIGIYEILNNSGYAVINMDYRLAPKYTYPAPLDDIETVIKLLQQKQSEWHLSTGRICLMGRSSGGQIALQYAYTRNDLGHIKAVVDFFGIPDLVDTNEMAPRLTPQIADYIGHTYSLAPQTWYDASPIHHVKTAIPTAIFHGTIDDTVYPIESEDLKDSLQQAGVPYLYFIRPGWGHGFDAPTWDNTMSETTGWIGQYMFK